jgi:hypothetical protein
MPPRSKIQFLLTWPSKVPDHSECIEAMRFREGHGIFRSIRAPDDKSVDVYITTSWDTLTSQKLPHLETTLPIHYKKHWDQLSYTTIYHAQIYTWLTSHREAFSRDQHTLRRYMGNQAKFLVYSVTAQQLIQKELRDSDSRNWSSNTRIAILDEWIKKDHLDLHEASLSKLNSPETRKIFQLDLFQNIDQFSE